MVPEILYVGAIQKIHSAAFPSSISATVLVNYHLKIKGQYREGIYGLINLLVLFRFLFTLGITGKIIIRLHVATFGIFRGILYYLIFTASTH